MLSVKFTLVVVFDQLTENDPELNEPELPFILDVVVVVVVDAVVTAAAVVVVVVVAAVELKSISDVVLSRLE